MASIGEGLNYKKNNPSMMMPLRSESMAYPKSPASDLMAQLQFYGRQHGQKVIATLAFLVFIVFVSSDGFHNANGLGGGLRHSSQ
jgi:hypothetical protein